MGNKLRSITGVSAIVILLLFFGAYGAYKARDFLAGPNIVFSSIKNGQTVDRSELRITGETFNIANLFVNGRKVIQDSAGKFETEMLLAAGYNIIEAKGTDKFGRETKKLMEIIYQMK